MSQSPLRSPSVSTRLRAGTGRVLRSIGSVLGACGRFFLRIARALARRICWLGQGALCQLQRVVPRRRGRLDHGRRSQGESRLVADCQAFLTGHYPSRLSRRSRWQWAWVNTLAHGSLSAIEQLASRRPGRRAGAAVFAAGEIVRAHDREGWDLAWFQREFLVPLEFECMGGTVNGSVATVERILAALRQVRPESRTHPAAPEPSEGAIRRAGAEGGSLS
jgi:hypothetical protein